MNAEASGARSQGQGDARTNTLSPGKAEVVFAESLAAAAFSCSCPGPELRYAGTG